MHKLALTIRNVVIAVILASGLAIFSVPAQSQAATNDLVESDFEPININGFGDPNNSYAWSMAWFNNKLYVGTSRNIFELSQWKDPKPEWDPWPVDEITLVDLGLSLRGEIWEYTIETDTWDRIHRSELYCGEIDLLPDYPIEGCTGRDPGYRSMTVADIHGEGKALYIGTHVYLGEEARILQMNADGDIKTLAVDFDESYELPPDVTLTSFRSLVPYNGRLYTTPVATGGGAQGSEVVRVFESQEIDWKDKPVDYISNAEEVLYDGTIRFRPVSDPNFGDPTNETIFEMCPFNGNLYVGTGNQDRGYQIWKSDLSGWPYTWTCVITDGAHRGPDNQGTASMLVFKDKLYVGGGVQGGGNDQDTGIFGIAELIRIKPDDSWQLICGHARSTPDGYKPRLSCKGPGFGDFFTGYFWRMEEHNGWLYVGTFDYATMLPILKNLDLWPWLKRYFADRQGGFNLWKSENGITWKEVTAQGLGNPLNLGCRTMRSSSHGLFLGTANAFTQGDDKGNPGGCEIWLGPTPDIIETVASDDRLVIFKAALNASDLADTLQGTGPYTVFAPTDQAFIDLMEQLGINEQDLLGNPQLVDEIIRYHIAPGKLTEEDLAMLSSVDTLHDDDIDIEVKWPRLQLFRKVLVNDANIVDKDQYASNGIIHVIDKVLIP